MLLLSLVSAELSRSLHCRLLDPALLDFLEPSRQQLADAGGTRDGPDAQKEVDDSLNRWGGHIIGFRS